MPDCARRTRGLRQQMRLQNGLDANDQNMRKGWGSTLRTGGAYEREGWCAGVKSVKQVGALPGLRFQPCHGGRRKRFQPRRTATLCDTQALGNSVRAPTAAPHDSSPFAIADFIASSFFALTLN